MQLKCIGDERPVGSKHRKIPSTFNREWELNWKVYSPVCIFTDLNPLNLPDSILWFLSNIASLYIFRRKPQVLKTQVGHWSVHLKIKSLLLRSTTPIYEKSQVMSTLIQYPNVKMIPTFYSLVQKEPFETHTTYDTYLHSPRNQRSIASLQNTILMKTAKTSSFSILEIWAREKVVLAKTSRC